MFFLCSASILGQNKLLSHKKNHSGTVTSHLGRSVRQKLLCKIGLNLISNKLLEKVVPNSWQAALNGAVFKNVLEQVCNCLTCLILFFIFTLTL